MVDTLQTLFVALATFAIVVAFHEYGHFWMARRAGVKVLRFSIGFGRPLFCWQGQDDTDYVIAVIPRGGYVRMRVADDRVVLGGQAVLTLKGELVGAAVNLS